MPTLKIDLATRILDDKMKVHLVHPGARYSFYNHVLEQNVLPVDVPFLEVANKQTIPDADKIALALERARMMRRWAKRPKADAAELRPSMDLDHYSTGLMMEAGAQGARTKLRNAAQQILWDIPGGTLVIVPAKGIHSSALLVELDSRQADRKTVMGHGHYAGLKFVARSLRVVAKVPMLALPHKVLEKVRSTSVVQEIDGHTEDQVLRLAYGDYQRDSEYVAGVMAQTDDFDALVLGQMIDLHVALEHFLQTGVALEPGRALYTRNIANAPHLHANINSPEGRASLESNGIATFALKLLAIAAASGIALTVAGDLIAQGHLIVENSANEGGDTAVIQASANALTDFFATSGHNNYKEYLEGLQDGLNRNATSPQGTAEVQP
jgi:hypothetical protein